MSVTEKPEADFPTTPAAGRRPSEDDFPREPDELRILRAIRRIIRSVALSSKKLAMEYGITAPQLVCLLKIRESGPLSSKALSREVYLSPSTIVGIVDRLERKGLIQRERSTGDRRLVLLTLTSLGQEVVSHAPSPLQDALAKALRESSELERATIALSLERLVDLMDIKQIDASPILETEPSLQPHSEVSFD